MAKRSVYNIPIYFSKSFHYIFKNSFLKFVLCYCAKFLKKSYFCKKLSIFKLTIALNGGKINLRYTYIFFKIFSSRFQKFVLKSCSLLLYKISLKNRNFVKNDLFLKLIITLQRKDQFTIQLFFQNPFIAFLEFRSQKKKFFYFLTNFS